jgi:hypothetical protein
MRSLPSALARFNWSSDRPAPLVALGTRIAAAVPAGSAAVAPAARSALAVPAAVLLLAELRGALAALLGALAAVTLRVAAVAASAAVAPAVPVAVAERLAARLMPGGRLGRLGARKQAPQPAEESTRGRLGRGGRLVGWRGLVAPRPLVELRALVVLRAVVALLARVARLLVAARVAPVLARRVDAVLPAIGAERGPVVGPRVVLPVAEVRLPAGLRR